MMDKALIEENLDDLGHIETSNFDIQRVFWIAFWANVGLALLKVTVGALGYSRLLIIDGLNSAANAMVVTTIIFGLQMSRPKAVSKKYPYGKGKAQFLASLIVGSFLTVAAAAILALSIKTFFIPVSLEPTGVGLAVALISICGNLFMFRFLRQMGSIYKNGAIQRIARLHTLNIASSLVVIQSLLGGLLGWFVAERMGSLSISLLVIWLSIRIIKSSLDGVMDRSVGKKMISMIKELAVSVDEVEDLQWVRTRYVGMNLCVDIKVGLCGDHTMHKVDRVAASIRQRLFSNIERLSHVTVHCYPV